MTDLKSFYPFQWFWAPTFGGFLKSALHKGETGAMSCCCWFLIIAKVRTRQLDYADAFLNSIVLS